MLVTKDTVTDEEMKMIELMKGLKIKPPNVETPEELEQFMNYILRYINSSVGMIIIDYNRQLIKWAHFFLFIFFCLVIIIQQYNTIHNITLHYMTRQDQTKTRQYKLSQYS